MTTAQHISTALSAGLQTVLTRVVNPSHGLFTHLREDRPARHAGGIRIVQANMAPPAYFRKNSPSTVRTADNGSGASFDRESAYWAALGEGLERYSASIYWPDDLTSATAAALDHQAVNLSALIRTGRPEVTGFDPAALRKWVKGLDLVSGRTKAVPASMCFLGYCPEHEGETISQSDSTGLACGQTFESAALRGICELMERDAFAANWYLHRQPPALSFSQGDLDALSAPVAAVVTNAHLPIRWAYVSGDYGVHVVCAFIADGSHHCAIGAAASPSIKRAVEKATAEVLQGWVAIHAFPELNEPLAMEALKTPFDHMRYYAHPSRMPVLAEMFEGKGEIAFADLRAGEASDVSAKDIAVCLASHGFDCVAVDLTTNDVRDLGLRVVRVVAPGLQPLVFGQHSTVVPDSRRLDQWRQIWKVSEPSLNPHPHPFP